MILHATIGLPRPSRVVTYCIYYLDLGRCPGILRPASGGMPLPQSAAHPPFPPASLLRNGRKRSSVAYELRLRAVAEARREAALRLRMVALRVAIGLLALAATLSVTFIGASAKGDCVLWVNLLFDINLFFNTGSSSHLRTMVHA